MASPPRHQKKPEQEQKERQRVSDVNSNTQDEFFDDAQDVFPGKEDLKDRLVAVYALEKGTDFNDRKEPYPIVQSVTLVLDDGPDGWQATVIRDGEQAENRVASVEAEGIQELSLRWSTNGMVSRLAPRVGKTFKPMIGRINSRPNKTKGHSASWSISSPTDADKDVARKYEAELRAISARLEAEANKATDAAAFDV
jgi:hypothetical protein